MRVFVLTDAHGNWQLFEKATKLVGANDLCFYLGDAIDRGPDGMKIIDFLFAHNDQYVYLKGNHEELFINSMREYVDFCAEHNWQPYQFARQFDFNMTLTMSSGDASIVHYNNGGNSTFASWVKDTKCDLAYLHKLEALPLTASIDITDKEGHTQTYDFCHAGCTIEEWKSQDSLALLWSRSHFRLNWIEGHILVHGHTPIRYMKRKHCAPPDHPYGAPLIYREGSKINLDYEVFNTGILNVLEINEDGDQIIHRLTNHDME